MLSLPSSRQHAGGFRASLVPRRAAAVAPYERHARDPAGFFRSVLGIDPWGRHHGLPEGEASQVDPLEAMRDCPMVAHKSGHKVGKSTSGAGIALWWVLSRVGGHVILTAPSYDQVKKPIWAEIRSLVSQAHPAQKNKRLPKLPGRLNLEPHSGYELGPNWGIWGKATDKPERIAGPSGANVLYIVDEASGFDERLLEAILGGLAGNGKVLLLGNPTRTSGAFYEVFDIANPKHDAWKCLHTSSTSTPNFFGRRIPGLADPGWIETTAKPLWGGPGNPVYDVRVLGKFPGQASNSIVSLDLLEEAKRRWRELEKTRPVAELGSEDGRLEIGLDIARDGDDETIVFARRGKRAYPVRIVNLDPRLAHADDPVPLGHQAALGAVRAARQLRKANEGPTAPKAMRPRIKVDEIGNGAAALDHLLAKFAREFEIVGVKVSERADSLVMLAPGVTAEGYYANKRAQLVYGVRDWLAAGGTIPPDGKLDAELVAPTWHATSSGKIAVESKDEIKKRLKRSPDRADAAGLSCYEPPKAPPRVVTEVGDGWGTYSVG
jgi:phage terminase large subunit